MAALPETNTARVWVNYSDGIWEHSAMLRFDQNSAAPGDALQVLADWFTEMDSLLALITIVSAERAVSGSNVRNPVTWPGAATYGTGAAQEANAPRQLMFEGRDTAGHPWRLSLFGYDEAQPPNYRIQNAASAPVAAAYAALANGAGIGALVTIANIAPVFKSYISFNYNNHYEVKQRG